MFPYNSSTSPLSTYRIVSKNLSPSSAPLIISTFESPPLQADDLRFTLQRRRMAMNSNSSRDPELPPTPLSLSPSEQPFGKSKLGERLPVLKCDSTSKWLQENTFENSEIPEMDFDLEVDLEEVDLEDGEIVEDDSAAQTRGECDRNASPGVDSMYSISIQSVPSRRSNKTTRIVSMSKVSDTLQRTKNSTPRNAPVFRGRRRPYEATRDESRYVDYRRSAGDNASHRARRARRGGGRETKRRESRENRRSHSSTKSRTSKTTKSSSDKCGKYSADTTKERSGGTSAAQAESELSLNVTECPSDSDSIVSIPVERITPELIVIDGSGSEDDDFEELQLRRLALEGMVNNFGGIKSDEKKNEKTNTEVSPIPDMVSSDGSPVSIVPHCEKSDTINISATEEVINPVPVSENQVRASPSIPYAVRRDGSAVVGLDSIPLSSTSIDSPETPRNNESQISSQGHAIQTVLSTRSEMIHSCQDIDERIGQTGFMSILSPFFGQDYGTPDSATFTPSNTPVEINQMIRPNSTPAEFQLADPRFSTQFNQPDLRFPNSTHTQFNAMDSRFQNCTQGQFNAPDPGFASPFPARFHGPDQVFRNPTPPHLVAPDTRFPNPTAPQFIAPDMRFPTPTQFVAPDMRFTNPTPPEFTANDMRFANPTPPQFAAPDLRFQNPESPHIISPAMRFQDQEPRQFAGPDNRFQSENPPQPRNGYLDGNLPSSRQSWANQITPSKKGWTVPQLTSVQVGVKASNATAVGLAKSTPLFGIPISSSRQTRTPAPNSSSPLPPSQGSSSMPVTPFSNETSSGNKSQATKDKFIQSTAEVFNTRSVVKCRESNKFIGNLQITIPNKAVQPIVINVEHHSSSSEDEQILSQNINIVNTLASSSGHVRFNTQQRTNRGNLSEHVPRADSATIAKNLLKPHSFPSGFEAQLGLLLKSSRDSAIRNLELHNESKRKADDEHAEGRKSRVKELPKAITTVANKSLNSPDLIPSAVRHLPLVQQEEYARLKAKLAEYQVIQEKAANNSKKSEVPPATPTNVPDSAVAENVVSSRNPTLVTARKKFIPAAYISFSTAKNVPNSGTPGTNGNSKSESPIAPDTVSNAEIVAQNSTDIEVIEVPNSSSRTRAAHDINVQNSSSSSSAGPTVTRSSIPQLKENSTPISLYNNAVDEKHETFLRQKLLKATLLRKMEVTQTKVKLARAENKLLTTRASTIQQLDILIEKAANICTKKMAYRNMIAYVARLRDQLLKADQKLGLNKMTIQCMLSELSEAAKELQAQQQVCNNLEAECKTFGSKLAGQNYNVPERGGAEMTSKLKKIELQANSLALQSLPVIPSTRYGSRVVRGEHSNHLQTIREFNSIASGRGRWRWRGRGRGNFETKSTPAVASPTVLLLPRPSGRNRNNETEDPLHGLTKHYFDTVGSPRGDDSFLTPNHRCANLVAKRKVKKKSLVAKFKEYSTPLPLTIVKPEQGQPSDALTVDPEVALCSFELLGICHSEACPFQHLSRPAV